MAHIESSKELYYHLTKYGFKRYKNYLNFDKIASEFCKLSEDVFKFNSLDIFDKDECTNKDEDADYFSITNWLKEDKSKRCWFSLGSWGYSLDTDYLMNLYTLVESKILDHNLRFMGLSPALIDYLYTVKNSCVNCQKPFEDAFIALPVSNILNISWINIRIYDANDFDKRQLGGWLPLNQFSYHALGQPYGDHNKSIFRDIDDLDVMEALARTRSFIIVWCTSDIKGERLSDLLLLDKELDNNVVEFNQRISTRHSKYKDNGIDYTRLDEINNFVINFIGYLTEPSQIVYAPQPETIEPTRKMKASEKLNLKSYTFLDVKPEVIIKKEPVGTHRSPEPHLRRGHYRRQRYGKGLKQEKLIFIPELKVNATKEK